MTVPVRELEHGPVEIVDLPTENGGSFHSYVNLPESNSNFTMFFVGDIWWYIYRYSIHRGLINQFITMVGMEIFYHQSPAIEHGDL